MITETRSKKDLMRGGGLCYLHFHRTPHIHCNRFSIFYSPAHCPLSPKDQSPLEQNHFASIQKVLSRWYKRQALIRNLTASRFHWTTKRGVNWTVTLLGLIRVWPARTTSCPVFFSFWSFNLFSMLVFHIIESTKPCPLIKSLATIAIISTSARMAAIAPRPPLIPSCWIEERKS